LDAHAVRYTQVLTNGAIEVEMEIRVVWVSLLLLASMSRTAPAGTAIPAAFDSAGTDRAAIETLLSHYTQSVSSKDQALFESLLLNTLIPFAYVSASDASMKAGGATERYEGFRKAVFQGAPFQQRFQNIHIQQDESLAQVSLVFVNTTAKSSSWGWKTLQLLKVGGQWKIASEFYTVHD